MTSAVALVVLAIGILGAIFAASTAVSFLHMMSDSVEVANGNTNALQDLGQSISDEVTFDVSSGLIIALIIAVCAVPKLVLRQKMHAKQDRA
jgi:hypothetical protein